MSRKYLPSVGDLIDRLAIDQIKEVLIPEHKEHYAREIKDIMHDIESLGLDAELIRAVIVVAQMNLHIWHNESEARKGIKAGENLMLTHGINGIRNGAKNRINCLQSEEHKQDFKVDCLAAEFKNWEISW